ncbi:MAG: NUDIX hydrolase [Oscillospiraceae bacterium]|nr:NUDIX hydrolase [Oscillospiraceae bacterium]
MDETSYLQQYRKEDYDRPSVTVDLVLLTIRDGALQVLLTRRQEHPFRGKLALPGVFVGTDETLDEAAERALSRKTGLSGIYFEQLYTWGALGRDPRMRVISVSYYALVPWEKISHPNREAEFYPVQEAADASDLAFDHAQIIRYARERIRNKISYTDIAFSLVGEEFTLPELQKVYEIILGVPLYKANFRKKIADRIEVTDKMTTGDKHRPSRIYRKKHLT